MKILFVADPLNNLKSSSDSSFAMVEACLELGHLTYWATPEDVFWQNTQTFVRARFISDINENVPQLEETKEVPLSFFKLVFIRKDPPFDTHYFRLCWLLAFEEKKVKIVNPPSLLLRYHEKILPLEAFKQGYLKKKDLIETYIGDVKGAESFTAKEKIDPIVVKPFYGYGGNAIELLSAGELGRSSLFEEGALVQKFYKEVKTLGDRRVFFLKGEILADVVRLPKEGSFISNLAQGGTSHQRKYSAAEKSVLQRLGKFLKDKKISLAGADLIGTKLSEVNITSPTGLRAIESLENKNYAFEIIKKLAR